MPARLVSVRVPEWMALLVVASHPGAAHADPPPAPGVTGAPVPGPPTRDVTGAPVPGAESGQIRSEEQSPSVGRVVACGALFIPRAIVWLLAQPIRGVIWTYDRYDLYDRYYNTFYNRDRTFGIHPSVEYATGFGLMFGARLVATDTFGEHEHLTTGGAYGGTHQATADAWLDSGVRLDPVVLTVGGNFDRYARLPFYGVGNADRSPRPAMLIDPLTNDTAVKSYYRYQELRAAVFADWRVLDDLHLIGQGAITDLQFSASTREPPIDEVYDPADLVGFEHGPRHLYGQLELRWDRRRVARLPWETTRYTTGWLASGFVGGVRGFDEAHDFVHYGVDLQAFIHFALGPRMLWLRFWGEGVTNELDEIPFTELPYLGGDFLRGYDFARFRDRVAGLGTAQYIWDISRYVNAYLFVDAGRVYRSLEDVTLDDLRVGFGGGVEVHTNTDFVVAVSLASSRDGGLFLTATLDPLWNKVPRWR